MSTTRNIGLDLFRIVMMFGICLIHACGQGEFKNATLHNIAMPCVVGFAMLSGYFGLRFSPSKILRLYSMAIGYCLVIPLVGNTCQGGYMHSVIETWGAPWRYWYLHAYAALLCLAPAIKAERLAKVQPFFFIVFVWGFLLSFCTFADYIPRAEGFRSHTFVTLLGIYLVTRVAKERHLFEKPSILSAIALVSITLVALILIPASGSYNSPVALVFIFALFVLFSRIESLGRFDGVVRYLAPSMFGVYLLHCAIVFPGISTKCYGLINFLESIHVAHGVPVFAVYIIVALEVFTISLIFDLIRRGLLKPIRGSLNALLKRVDSAYERLCH